MQSTHHDNVCSIAECGRVAAYRLITARARRVVRDEDVCDLHARDVVAAWIKDTNASFGTPLRRETAIEVDVAVLLMNRMADSHFVCLTEVGGSRKLSFSIGILEGSALAYQLRGNQNRRRFVYDHISEMIKDLGGQLQDTLIYDVGDDGTSFKTHLRIKQDMRIVLSDIRPSDALCIAIASRVPFLIGESVIARTKKAMKDFERQYE